MILLWLNGTKACESPVLSFASFLLSGFSETVSDFSSSPDGCFKSTLLALVTDGLFPFFWASSLPPKNFFPSQEAAVKITAAARTIINLLCIIRPSIYFRQYFNQRPLHGDSINHS